MLDLDTLVIMTGIVTNATSLVHTVQEMRDNPDSGVVGNYRSFLSWALGGERNNPSYKAFIPQQIVAIPLAGAGVVLGTFGKRIVDYFRKNSVPYEE